MRIIGLDVGINSIGFSYVDLSKKEILAIGSHLFEAAEHPKTGASLAIPRRTARGQRRRLYRKARKIARLRIILKDHGLPVQKHIRLNSTDLSPWELRKLALERVLTPDEFGRALLHFAKRPGFESNRKSAPNDSEGPLLSGSKELTQKMLDAGCPTIGAYLADLPKQRNDPESYGRTVLREDLKVELSRIFDHQRKLGNTAATDSLKQSVIETAFFRLPLRSSLDLVAQCRLEPEDKRAAKRAYHSELFVALSRLNTLRIEDKGGDKRPLTSEEIALFEEKIHSTTKVTFAQARKLLSLTDRQTFNLASYLKIKEGDNSWEAIRDQAEKATLVELSGFQELRKCVSKISKLDWQALSHTPDALDQIAHALSFFEAEDQIRAQLEGLPLNENQTIALMKISSKFSKTIDLSLKAVKNIIPLLRQGKSYSEAVKLLYPDAGKKQGEQHFLPPLSESTRNPIVDRSISQIRKLVNALIRTHGMPDHFHLETARDLGHSFSDRKKIERENKTRQKYKEDTKKHATEIYGYEPNGEELAKFRLWKEQGGLCFYSGEPIAPQWLRDGTQTQIDHILPYSRSFDDSWSNKTLCLARENQRKKNETAWEYMARKDMSAILEDFASTQDMHRAKKMLMKDFNDEKSKEWKSRHLNDTRYIARLIAVHLEEHLKPNQGIKKLVQTRKGALTSKLRHLWGLPEKDRENDHRHHGIDALIIACSTQSMVQAIARWNKYQRPAKDKDGFYAEKPWPTFREDALAKVKDMFVTRQPARKTGGQLHKDTIMRLKTDTHTGNWQAIKRIKVLDLKLGDLENLVDIDIKDGVVSGRNAALYHVLKERLEAFDGDAKKAFTDPIYMPTGPNAKERPQIRRIRVHDNSKSGFIVRNGIADNAEMAWTEVYEREGKFFLLPVYTHQVATENWPNRLITSNKPESEWDVLSDAHTYKFTLFKNDFVVLENKKGEVLEGYFKGSHRGTGQIRCVKHNETQEIAWGSKTLRTFCKFNIDFFGNRSEIRETKPWRGEQS